MAVGCLLQPAIPLLLSDDSDRRTPLVFGTPLLLPVAARLATKNSKRETAVRQPAIYHVGRVAPYRRTPCGMLDRTARGGTENPHH